MKKIIARVLIISLLISFIFYGFNKNINTNKIDNKILSNINNNEVVDVFIHIKDIKYINTTVKSNTTLQEQIKDRGNYLEEINKYN